MDNPGAFFQEQSAAIVDDVIDALVRPVVPVSEKAAAVAERIVAKGTIREVTDFFYTKVWTDGLPIIPPTEEAVKEMLQGTDLPANLVLGIFAPRKAEVTPEVVAINAVMAGCLPTYLPVVIAATKAILHTDFRLLDLQTTTNPSVPMVIVNGPIRGELQINSSWGVLGPYFRANDTIGRAIRLMMISVGQALPGVNQQTTPGKFSDYCVAEFEEESPWEPLNVERGFPKGSNVVTVKQISGVQMFMSGSEVPAVLNMITHQMQLLGPITGENPEGDVLLMLGPVHANTLGKAGLTRRDVQDYIVKNCWVTRSLLESVEGPLSKDAATEWGVSFDCPPDTKLFQRRYPERITIFVAQSPNLGWSTYFCGHTKRKMPISMEIELPKNWKQLLEKYKEPPPRWQA